MTKLLMVFMIAGSAQAAGAAGEDVAVLVHDSVIDERAHMFPRMTFSVPTVHGVTFQQEGVVTYNDWQFAAYYNAAGHVSIGRRPLPDGEWETFSLSDYTFTTVDSHNSVVLGIAEEDGTIHLSFDHHNAPLKYRVSVAGAADYSENVAWTPALFGPVRDSLDGGATVNGVTYPRFIPSPDGSLLFTYRIGGSGAGDEILYEYDGVSGEWSLIGLYIARTGSYSGTFTGSSSTRNAYPDNTLFDRNGRLHMTWCWRETPDPRSNHDIYYAYSDDQGRTWRNEAGGVAGTAGADPLRVDSPGLKVVEIPQNRNYINNSGMTIDAAGRVHVVAWHFPDSEPDLTSGFSTSLDSAARFHHYWRGHDGIWHRNETSLTGTRPKLAADDDGQLYLAYGGPDRIRIATATPESGWSDWSELALTGALPEGQAHEVNLVFDPLRWERDRIFSIYAQETNGTDFVPTPLHILDYHVSRGAIVRAPANGSSNVALDAELVWLSGRGAVSHDLYLGTSREAVENAGPLSGEYQGQFSGERFQHGAFEQDTRVHWRVDAVDGDGAVTPGRVWTFETVRLSPAVTSGALINFYGGKVTIEGSLQSATGAPATVILYRGPVDGGTDPGAWQHATDLGERHPGPLSVEQTGWGEDAIFFRFFASNEHGAGWSPAGVKPAHEDLAYWEHASEITIDFGEALEALDDFPVLVRLGRFEVDGFSYDDFRSPPFGDLRFSDVSGNQILPFEVEQWNPAGTSFVWVRVPRIERLARIRVWWGREGRAAQSRAGQAEVWSAQFAGVWHLDEAAGFGLDSSPHATPSSVTAISAAASAVVPGAGSFNGGSSAIRVENSTALNPALISVEAWIRTTQGGIASIVGKDRTTAGGGRVWQFRINDGRFEFIVFSSDAHHSVTSGVQVATGQWRHVAGTWDGAMVRVYVDGELSAESSFAGALRSGQGNDLFIGRMETQSPAYFAGDLDEVRISGVARSADWIRVACLNQRPGSTVVASGGAAWPDLDDDLLPDSWEMEHFGSIDRADGRGGSDTSGNGVPDLLAFATGVDPLAGGGNGFPFAELEPDDDGGYPTFTYDQIAGGSGEVGIGYTAGGLRYVVEFSPDLFTWLSGSENVGFTGVRQSLPGGMERVTVAFTGGAGSERSRLFARLRVEPGF